jgi:cytochrome c peroxidase
MKKTYLACLFLVAGAVLVLSFSNTEHAAYLHCYKERITQLQQAENNLSEQIKNNDLSSPAAKQQIKQAIDSARIAMKAADIWLRYLEPLAYKKINGPLPVEWETEVFEKFEQPYRREGAGLSLAAQYLDEPVINKDSLLALVKAAMSATAIYHNDSIIANLTSYHHFFLCNRLMLLNMASIYSTGFECPDATSVIPELRAMLHSLSEVYAAYNSSFPATPITQEYIDQFNNLIAFADAQPSDIEQFDHFTFIKSYVNPLFRINQAMIGRYNVVSRSLVDYTLNKRATSIFDKNLYNGQNTKGIFIRVQDEAALQQIAAAGKLLFYDPVLSGNNQRSCASCHKPDQFFTDTSVATSLQYNSVDHLPRNTPTLINAGYNHLVMLDGKHITLQNQTRDVITNTIEMGCDETEMVKKVMSCKKYRRTFQQLVKYTPEEPTVTYRHIVSAITYYYGSFSNATSLFDSAMEGQTMAPLNVQRGFNLFMGKAQCGTCHFVPQFNGVKPPFVSSEFEVIGVPQSPDCKKLSADEGRYKINPATETRNAFRTGSIRNAARTMPYMHNGVFKTLDQVIDFYDAGGGAGNGLVISNQTLSPDSLHLTANEKRDLVTFISSLNENIKQETPPATLPTSKQRALNYRKVGGVY